VRWAQKELNGQTEKIQNCIPKDISICQNALLLQLANDNYSSINQIKIILLCEDFLQKTCLS